MPNLLKIGAEWLAEQLAAHAAETVYFHRPPVASGSASAIPAVLGRSEFDVDQGDGGLVRIIAHDFIVAVADFEFGEPAEGDRFIVGTLGAGEVYEAMSIPGEPAWRYTDEFRTQYRIHTKHVETES
jgi:hypothetical protein